MHRLEFSSFPDTENDGPHHTTRSCCQSFVLTRAIPSCTEDASKSDRARQTDQFWQNASRLTRTCSVQEGQIRRPAKTPCPRSLGTSKPGPDRPLGDRRSSKPTPYARVCNMITGEEQERISENASLLCCIVEMLNFNTPATNSPSSTTSK